MQMAMINYKRKTTAEYGSLNSVYENTNREKKVCNRV